MPRHTAGSQLSWQSIVLLVVLAVAVATLVISAVSLARNGSSSARTSAATTGAMGAASPGLKVRRLSEETATLAGGSIRGAAPPTKVEKTKVLVIGMGITGAKIVTTLEEHGLGDWIAVEALPVPGGRTTSASVGGYKVEAGASWVQGLDGNPIWPLVQQCGLAGWYQNWNSEVDYDEHGQPTTMRWADFERAMACLDTDLGPYLDHTVGSTTPNGTVNGRAALRACGWIPKSANDWAVEHSVFDFEWAVAAEAVNADIAYPWNTYSYFQDADYFITDQTGGFGKLTTCLLEGALPGGRHDLRIRYSTPVVNVDVATRTVTLQSGKKIQAEYIISTIPNGVLQYDLVENDGKLFTPAFDRERQLALQQYDMNFYMKLFLQFDRIFWDRAEFVLTAGSQPYGPTYWQILDVGTPPNADNKSPLPGSKTIFVTILDPMSSQYLRYSDEVLVGILRRELEKIYGQAARDAVLVDAYFADWPNHPYARGSYSNPSASYTYTDFYTIFAPLDGAAGRVRLSGEAYCRDLSGYVHSGYMAGETSALEALQKLGYTITKDPFDNECWRPPVGKNTHKSAPAGASSPKHKRPDLWVPK